MKKLILFAVLLSFGCGEDKTVETPSFSKSEVASANGKGDDQLDNLCEELGKEPGCDPCAVQNWYGDGTCDAFCPLRDADCGVDDYIINVDFEEELSATMSIIYQSSKDSFGCTDLKQDGFSFRRVPEQVRENVEGNCTESRCSFTFPNELGDGCESVIRHIYLEPSNTAGTISPWASLAFVSGGTVDSQVVACQESDSPNGPLMNCGNDLLHYSDNGEANVSLTYSGE